ncbi:MAG: 1-acyl-sn-glycerol-3-phosphate acyltransferase [Planctomycetota bacterium]|nr:MAG: 1-acyl-sn-glycerol-3-phosphate acyltransferase [Planctomycetota bacterium]
MPFVSFDNPIARLFYLSIKGLGNLLYGMGFSAQVIGERHIPESGPVIIASNHPSFLDPVLIGIKVRRRVRFMAWDLIFRIPVIAFMAESLGAFPVSMKKMGKDTLAKTLEILSGGHVLGIFPDGKRTDSGKMENLKPGAVRMALTVGAPIVPCSIIGAFKAWPKTRLWCQTGEITVVFHPPIVFSEEEKKHKRDQEFIEEINGRIKNIVNTSIDSPPVRRGAPLTRARSR